MKKLDQLREHLLQAPINIKADKLLSFVDRGKVISYAGGDNQDFRFEYQGNIIITDYSDDADKLAFFIVQWYDQYQPDHKSDGFQFDADIINHKSVDVSITLELTETIAVTETATGIDLVHCDEPNILPVPIPADEWTLYANDDEVAKWVDGG